MRLKKIVKTCLAFILAVSVFPIFSMNADASAKSITIPSATFYDSGALKSLNIQFDWNSAQAPVRLTLMKNRLRSAGEEGTSKNYGDFTDFGYYGSSFKNFQEVLQHDVDNQTFGILSYSDEIILSSYNDNQVTFDLLEDTIPLDVNATYYVYLWTQYSNNCYPDNLVSVINVEDEFVSYTPATERNEYDAENFFPKLLPLEEMVFNYAYDVQRSPAFPKEGDLIYMSGLSKPYLSDGSKASTNEGSWTLTSIGTYETIKDGEKDSSALNNIVDSIASKYTDLNTDTIIIHELKDGNTHIAYGVTVSYKAHKGLAVYIGDNLNSGCGFLLSTDGKSGTVSTNATPLYTGSLVPQQYTITVENTANGTTTASLSQAVAGDVITITATPNEGYQVASVKYNDGDDHEITLVDGKYTFTMPEKNVTVTATYSSSETHAPSNGTQTPSNGTEAPKTSDTNNGLLWAVLAIGSCGLYKCVLEYERRQKRIRRR